MDDGPSSSRVPWLWRAQLRLQLALPKDDRRKIKTIVTTGDTWKDSGYVDEAIRLYQEAAQLAKRSKSYHLRKVAQKRLANLSRTLPERELRLKLAE